MTSMAVTARICASAPEAAFLVASFMSLSMSPGIPIDTTHLDVVEEES